MQLYDMFPSTKKNFWDIQILPSRTGKLLVGSCDKFGKLIKWKMIIVFPKNLLTHGVEFVLLQI